MTRLSGSQIRLAVLLLFLGAIAYQLVLSVGTVAWLAHEARPVRPFGIVVGTNRIQLVTPNAVAAGVKTGDELLSIDGRPYAGRAVWSSEFSGKRAGETMTFTIRTAGTGSPRPVSIPLDRGAEISPYGWPALLIIYGLTQVCALLLGFGVALIRPRDPMAWLLLIMLVSFASFSASGDLLRDTIRTWPDGFRQAGIFYHVAVGDLWSICMLLFGIYFAGRLPLDSRLPGLKWLLLAPVGLSAILDGAYHVAESESIAKAAFLQPLVAVTDPISAYAGMAAISLFFFAMWSKSYAPSVTPDARRRLRLVAWGASVALTPLFFVAIRLFVLRLDVPEDVVLLCVLPLAVFPLALAYVIVVHRALDVRVVLRQGLQYALAQRGIRAMQLLLTLLVIGLAVSVGSQRLHWAAKLLIVTGGAVAIAFMDKAARSLSNWTDRRFFREAHNAELILNELNESVRTIVESGLLLETVARKIGDSLHVARMAILVKSSGAYQVEYAAGYDSPPHQLLQDEGAVATRLKRERKPQRVYFDDPDSWIYAANGTSDAERGTLRALDAQLLLPLACKESLAGVIVLGPKRSEEPYAPSDVRLLESVAAQTGLALENSRLTTAVAAEVAQRERSNREMEIAREVQERLFPQSPKMIGLDCAGHCRPALGVGGDYYDWLALPGGGLGIAIGDVSGKGVPAALLMASLQASLRSQAIAAPKDLAALMSNLNQLIFDATPSNRYATFFYAQYEPATRRLEYVNAGHNPPMLFRRDELIRLDQGGPVVGLFRPAQYVQAGIQLQPGDVLVLYTDGVSEAMNPAEEEWEEEQLAESVRQCGNVPAAEMLDRTMHNADAFAAGAPQHDDMTLMVMKLL
jgi:sigma-B regulation protein RsbU (phosphoserine phosphatase)